MLKIGVAQIANSTDIDANDKTISSFLERFEKVGVDLVLFPECSLSGFSAKISESSMDRLLPFLDLIHQWSQRTGIHVVLPTAVSEDGKVYNSGFYFGDSNSTRFQKLGLKESEKKFFSISDIHTEKIFQVKQYRFAVLICMEAQQEAFRYFKEGELDFILWPGYWGWTKDDSWAPATSDPLNSKSSTNGKINLVYENMNSWKIPLIQANFAYNDFLDGRNTGPEGLSVVVDGDNTLRYRAEHKKEMGFIVILEGGKVKDCEML